MSGRKAKAARKITKHPATDHPAFFRSNEVTNLAELAAESVLVPCVDWAIVEYHPLPDGQGKPTQVRIMITPDEKFSEIIGAKLHFMMCLKSKEACDALIAVLQSHRNNVWGDT